MAAPIVDQIDNTVQLNITLSHANQLLHEYNYILNPVQRHDGAVTVELAGAWDDDQVRAAMATLAPYARNGGYLAFYCEDDKSLFAYGYNGGEMVDFHVALRVTAPLP